MGFQMFHWNWSPYGTCGCWVVVKRWVVVKQSHLS